MSRPASTHLSLKYPWLLLVLTAAASVTGVGSVKAQTSSFEALQAAYIFNFAKYVKWPDASAGNLTIGVYGDDEIIEFLETALSGKKVAGRTMAVKAVSEPGDIQVCDIVYVADSGSKNLRAVLDAISGRSILVVTEEDLVRKGAAISFFVEDDRLKFKLRRSVLAASRLVASDGLLKLAILE